MPTSKAWSTRWIPDKKIRLNMALHCGKENSYFWCRSSDWLILTSIFGVRSRRANTWLCSWNGRESDCFDNTCFYCYFKICLRFSGCRPLPFNLERLFLSLRCLWDVVLDLLYGRWQCATNLGYKNHLTLNKNWKSIRHHEKGKPFLPHRKRGSTQGEHVFLFSPWCNPS